MSRALVDAYERIRHRITEIRCILRELRSEEASIVQQITDALVQSDQVGYRLDDGSIITVVDHERKAVRTGKDYYDYIKDVICMSRGETDEEIAAKIVDGKTKSTTTCRKLKIIKTK